MVKRYSVSAFKKITFCAAHRLKDHDGDCFNIHGHNYELLIGATSKMLDNGMVMDFAEIKARVKTWIDKHWDHSLIHQMGDKPMAEAVMAFNRVSDRKLKVFCTNAPPTAETLAMFLIERIMPDLFADTGVTVTALHIIETNSCFAAIHVDGD